MMAYIIILVLLLLIGAVNRESIMAGRNTTSLAVVASCGMLFVFAALRGPSVGADTLQYIQIFDWVKGLSFGNIGQLNQWAWWDTEGAIEITYKFYCKLVSILSSDSQAITIANSLVMSIALIRLVRNESSNGWLSVFLFFTLGFFQMSLNLTPSAIASLICLGSMKYIRERRFLPYFASVAIAMCFHSSAVFFVPLYFLFQLQLSKRFFLTFLVLGSLCVLIAYDPLVSVLMRIVPGKYTGYLLSSTARPEQLLVLGVYVVMFLLASFSSSEDIFDKDRSVELWICLLVCITYAMSYHNAYITRFSFLIAPYLIIVFVNFLYGGRSLQKALGTARIPMGLRAGRPWVAGMVAMGIVSYLVRISVNNIGITMPYIPFFD